MSRRAVRATPGKKRPWNESRFARWRKNHPWYRFVEWARRRCNDTDPRGWWPHYGAKGIQVHLDSKQLEEIWVRDRAHLLVRASLDRKNSAFDYANWNVRFIEFTSNARMAWDKAAQPQYAEQVPEFT